MKTKYEPFDDITTMTVTQLSAYNHALNEYNDGFLSTQYPALCKLSDCGLTGTNLYRWLDDRVTRAAIMEWAVG